MKPPPDFVSTIPNPLLAEAKLSCVLTVSVLLVSAVDPAVLALAVVTLAVGALHDAGGAPSRLVVPVPVVSRRSLLHTYRQQ